MATKILSHKASIFDEVERIIQLSTPKGNWVIPINLEIFKSLIKNQDVRAEDLMFTSDKACHQFTRKCLLLAAGDQIRNPDSNCLTCFARQLVQRQQTHESRSHS